MHLRNIAALGRQKKKIGVACRDENIPQMFQKACDFVKLR